MLRRSSGSGRLNDSRGRRDPPHHHLRRLPNPMVRHPRPERSAARVLQREMQTGARVPDAGADEEGRVSKPKPRLPGQIGWRTQIITPAGVLFHCAGPCGEYLPAETFGVRARDGLMLSRCHMCALAWTRDWKRIQAGLPPETAAERAAYVYVPDRSHGLSRTTEYRVWQTMRHRCLEKSSPAWDDYGGRGITICEGWKDSPEAFAADMGTRPERHEIDRIDNNGGYWCGHCADCISLGVTKTNCRWATRSTNTRNRRSTVWVEFRGERRRMIDLCEQFGIARGVVYHRLKKWTLEQSLTTPVRAKRPNGSGWRTEARRKAAA